AGARIVREAARRRSVRRRLRECVWRTAVRVRAGLARTGGAALWALAVNPQRTDRGVGGGGAAPDRGLCADSAPSTRDARALGSRGGTAQGSAADAGGCDQRCTAGGRGRRADGGAAACCRYGAGCMARPAPRRWRRADHRARGSELYPALKPARAITVE